MVVKLFLGLKCVSRANRLYSLKFVRVNPRYGSSVNGGARREWLLGTFHGCDSSQREVCRLTGMSAPRGRIPGSSRHSVNGSQVNAFSGCSMSSNSPSCRLHPAPDLMSILTKGRISSAALLYVLHMLRVRTLRPDWDWVTPL